MEPIPYGHLRWLVEHAPKGSRVHVSARLLVNLEHVDEDDALTLSSSEAARFGKLYVDAFKIVRRESLAQSGFGHFRGVELQTLPLQKPSPEARALGRISINETLNLHAGLSTDWDALHPVIGIDAGFSHDLSLLKSTQLDRRGALGVTINPLGESVDLWAAQMLGWRGFSFGLGTMARVGGVDKVNHFGTVHLSWSPGVRRNSVGAQAVKHRALGTSYQWLRDDAGQLTQRFAASYQFERKLGFIGIVDLEATRPDGPNKAVGFMAGAQITGLTRLWGDHWHLAYDTGIAAGYSPKAGLHGSVLMNTGIAYVLNPKRKAGKGATYLSISLPSEYGYGVKNGFFRKGGVAVGIKVSLEPAASKKR